MDKVLNYSLEINEFKLQLHYYIQFQTNTFGKGVNPLIPPAIGLIISLLICNDSIDTK